MAINTEGGAEALDPFSVEDLKRTMDKDDRKAVEFADMAAARDARAAAWSRDEAQRIAAQDLEALRAAQAASPNEAHYQRQDMERNATASPYYKAGLYAADPVIAYDLDTAKPALEAKEKPAQHWSPEAFQQHADDIGARNAAAKAAFEAADKYNPTLDQAFARAADAEKARAGVATPVNSVEPFVGREAQRLEGDAETQRNAWLSKSKPDQNVAVATAPTVAADNKVESDEIFTATNADVKQIVPPEVAKRYTQTGNKFYDPKDPTQPEFIDKGTRLETASSSEHAAESMVRIAEARGWDEIKVAGSESFRREAWMEAAARGMHVKGFTPSEEDKAALAKRAPEAAAARADHGQVAGKSVETDRSKAPETNDQRMARSFETQTTPEAVRQYPELAGAAAAAAALDKRAEVDGLNPAQRAVVAARVKQNIMNSIERGNLPQVTVREEVEQRIEVKNEREAAR